MKNKKDTIIITVIYPAVEKYLSNYCNSILIQDTNDFDILILNDKYIKSFPLKDKRITILNIENNLTPAEIRMLGIKYALNNNYKYIVFSDADDCFSINRISLSKDRLKKYDFVYNNIKLTNETGIIINDLNYSNLKIKEEYNSYLELIGKNIFGFTNTAVKAEKLAKLYIPKEIIAVDWWIFSILLLNKCKGEFIKEAITYYRQHNNNFIGISKKLNKTILHKGIKVKQIHYKNLLIYCEDHKMKEATKIYSKKLEEINTLNKYIQDDSFCKRYIEVINKNYSNIFNGWWSEILSLNEWGKYDERIL
jgi:hypothetical protein